MRFAFLDSWRSAMAGVPKMTYVFQHFSDTDFLLAVITQVVELFSYGFLLAFLAWLIGYVIRFILRLLKGGVNYGY